MSEQPLFRLEIEELGPIRGSAIELHPLTLLTGENNSGKTCLATVLWLLYGGHAAALQRYARHLEQRLPEAAQGPARTEGDPAGEWHTEVTDLKPAALAATTSLLGPLVQELLHLSSPRLALSPRGAASARLQDLHWNFPGVGSGVERLLCFKSPDRDCRPEAALPHLEGWPLDPGPSPRPTLLVPASRSALLHLLPRLTAELWRRPEQSEDLSPQLRHFVSHLYGAQWSRGAGPGEDLAALLEQGALRGRLRRGEREAQVFRFQPVGLQEALPMAQASSVVTELAPLIHILRQPQLPDTLIIEEVEAHLHPRVQRLVARALVRLVNRGSRLILSTHSDIIAQQVNYSLTLGHLRRSLPPEEYQRRRAQAGMEEEEALDPQQVGAWDFGLRADGSTAIARLPTTETGVQMPRFNAVLEEMQGDWDALVGGRG